MTASKILHYLVFYVAAFSDVIKSTHDVGFKVMSEHGILDYLESCYEPLHTQGRLYVLTDIVEMLIDRGYFPKDSSPFDIIPDYAGVGV